jgi:four helix bundle protein
MEKAKINNFTDLRVWQEAHKLVLIIYKTTENFPSHELYGLISQMRRAAVSITSNIAEGFSRATLKDKLKFYVMAHGSLTEVENQLMIARDLKYLENLDYEKIVEQLVYTHKILNSFIRSTNVLASSSSSF